MKHSIFSINVVVLLLILLPLNVFAQNETDIIEKDRPIVIPQGYRLTLEPIIKKGKLDGFRVLSHDTTKLYAKDDIMKQSFFLFSIREGEKENKNIIIDFSVIDNSDGGKDSYLLVYNPFSKKRLIYNAKISNDLKSFKETNVYPVENAKVGIETWPYAINYLTLIDFKLEK